MDACETCGNRYDKLMKITYGDETHVFDSFECAIHALAPNCAACGIKIVGHGMEANGEFYCCANCARAEHQEGLTDRQDQSVFL